MHITTVNIDGIWVSFDIENVKSTSKNCIKSENIQAVATFTKEGEKIHKIYNIGNFEFCTKLLDVDFAKKKAIEMIETSKKSKHNPFISC